MSSNRLQRLKEYEEYRISRGISPETIKYEVKLINDFFNYVDKIYNKNVIEYEIKPDDIKGFLMKGKERGLKDETIAKMIYQLRQWFHFLWDTNKIGVDYMTKLKFPKKLHISKPKIDINYEYLLSKKGEILSSRLSTYSKMIYLLYMRGLRVRDISSLTIDQLKDEENIITLTLDKDNGFVQETVFKGEELPIVRTCISRAKERKVPFLLSSKVATVPNKYKPINFGSIKDMVAAISNVVGSPFRSEHIRLAYVHYLYKKEGKMIEEIANILGISLSSASRMIKESLERVKIVEYNKN